MVSFDKDKKIRIAEESLKTRKAREKLKKKLEAFDRKVTPQALEKKAIEIQRWIARHASNRVVLKSKSISLFDENQNAAGLSQRISLLADQIKSEFQLPMSGEDHLKMSKLKLLITNGPKDWSLD